MPGNPAVFFNVLSPRVLERLAKLDSKVMRDLKRNIREAVRTIVDAGLADQRTPAEIAQELRSLVGLGPSQIDQVYNFRDALESGDVSKALSYAARDRRFDSLIRSGGLTQDRIDRMVSTYAERRVAINAQTIAKTASTDAMKAGQAVAWEQAVDNGLVPDGYELEKTWTGVGDDRERDEHLALNGETVLFDDLYSNGDDIPGENDYNCRCVSVIRAVPIGS